MSEQGNDLTRHPTKERSDVPVRQHLKTRPPEDPRWSISGQRTRRPPAESRANTSPRRNARADPCSDNPCGGSQRVGLWGCRRFVVLPVVVLVALPSYSSQPCAPMPRAGATHESYPPYRPWNDVWKCIVVVVLVSGCEIQIRNRDNQNKIQDS